MSAKQKYLELANVEKTFPTASGESLSILRGINLSLGAGDAIAITGPSGCGKTTLLNMIGALDTPTAGRVVIDGKDISEFDETQLAHFRNRKIGFVFQFHHLLPQCTVIENVLLPVLAQHKSAEAQRERACNLLDRVGLSKRLDHFPAQLSGGERQRVAVVRALINDPALLLADEPTGALDRASSDELTKLLLELNAEEKVTLIVVTHSLALATKMRSVYSLEDGELNLSNNGSAS